MARFLNRHIEDLARQLAYVPARRLQEQMDRAESLYWELDPQRSYPFDFLVFRITRFRPENSSDAMIPGETLRRDLLVLVERLSEAAGDRFDTHDPAPLRLDAVCRQLAVTDRTVARYRREGLFTRRLIPPKGRICLGFLPASLERFIAEKSSRLDRAATFSRIDEPTRHRILIRARRIVSRRDASCFEIARHLNRRMGRSTEAIRQLLLAHDRADPRVAIFPQHSPALGPRQRQVIDRAWRRGVSVARMARRFNRSRNAIYRAIHLERARRLRSREVKFIASPTFELPDAEQVILDAPIRMPRQVDASESSARTGDAFGQYLRELPARIELDADAERALFVRYNYVKYRAAKQIHTLDKLHPRAAQLDRIETDLRHAASIRGQIAEAFLRLIISVARRHAGPGRAAMGDLTGEGNLVLLAAIDTFDPNRGNRFSTYLSWALMRRFATLGNTPPRPPRELAIEEAATAGPDQQIELEGSLTALAGLIGRLEKREQHVLSGHYGLCDADGNRQPPQTLAQIGRQLGISAERARQIERRAIAKLRRLASEQAP